MHPTARVIGPLLIALISAPLISAVAQVPVRKGAEAGLDRLPPPRPVVARQLADGRIQVTWASVPGAEGYVISRSVPPTGMRVLSPPDPADTVYLDADVKPGSAHYYYVATVGGGGISLKAAAPPVTPTAPPTGGGTPPTTTPTTTPTTSPAAPSLPSPSFQATGFGSPASGAQNDAQGKIIRTSLTSLTAADFAACPLTPMFSFGSAGAAVPAAPFYTNTASTAPAAQKYTWISGSLYFRPPAPPDGLFPGGLPSPPGATNSWIHLVNCRNEYSNALAFRMEPTAFQITKVWPDGFIGGQQIVVSGTGLEGRISCGTTWCAPTQKVMFYFKLGKTNAAGTGMDVVERELEGALMSGSSGLDERAVNVYAPSLEGQGYTRATWALLESKVYVVRGGVRSNVLPARYCSSAENAARAGACF